jgi:hypothetical protein
VPLSGGAGGAARSRGVGWRQPMPPSPTPSAADEFGNVHDDDRHGHGGRSVFSAGGGSAVERGGQRVRVAHTQAVPTEDDARSDGLRELLQHHSADDDEVDFEQLRDRGWLAEGDNNHVDPVYMDPRRWQEQMEQGDGVAEADAAAEAAAEEDEEEQEELFSRMQDLYIREGERGDEEGMRRFEREHGQHWARLQVGEARRKAGEEERMRVRLQGELLRAKRQIMEVSRRAAQAEQKEERAVRNLLLLQGQGVVGPTAAPGGPSSPAGGGGAAGDEALARWRHGPR